LIDLHNYYYLIIFYQLPISVFVCVSVSDLSEWFDDLLRRVAFVLVQD